MTIKKLIISECKIVKMCGKEMNCKDVDKENVSKYLEKCVNRLRNTNLQKFQTMCKMHLSFLLDLPNLEELLNESLVDSATDIAGAKNGKKAFPHFTRRKSKPFHNCVSLPLNEDYITQVYQLVQYLGQPHNICQEGLFRKTGQLTRQKQLKSRLYAGEPLCLDNDEFSAHDCASVLKSYLGDLQEPLLTERYYKAHRQVPEMMPDNVASLADETRKLRFQKQIKSVQLLILLLPSMNAAVLSLVLDLLYRVSQQPQTRMTAANLGTLFAPHLLCPRDVTAGDLHAATPDITKAIAFMIEHAQKLFQVPVDLARDIANYWKQMEEINGTSSHSGSACSINDTDLANNMTFGIPLSRNESSVALNTIVRFVDQEASERARAETDTETALAQLYAHVQCMPESSRKKKLLKQFNKTNNGISGTPLSTGGNSTFFNSRTKSLYGSIRKRFCKSSKKENCNQSLNVSKENLLSSQLTPITSIFAKKKITNVDRTFTKSPRKYTPKKSLHFTDDIASSPSTDGKVCIVDMNHTAPSFISPPYKRKHDDDSVVDSPTAKKTCAEPKVAKKIEALLSPIPHRASAVKQLTPRQQRLTPRCRAPLTVFHSPGSGRLDESGTTKAKMDF